MFVALTFAFGTSLLVLWLSGTVLSEKICQKAEHASILLMFDNSARPLGEAIDVYRPAMQWLMDITAWERLNLRLVIDNNGEILSNSNPTAFHVTFMNFLPHTSQRQHVEHMSNVWQIHHHLQYFADGIGQFVTTNIEMVAKMMKKVDSTHKKAIIIFSYLYREDLMDDIGKLARAVKGDSTVTLVVLEKSPSSQLRALAESRDYKDWFKIVDSIDYRQMNSILLKCTNVSDCPQGCRLKQCVWLLTQSNRVECGRPLERNPHHELNCRHCARETLCLEEECVEQYRRDTFWTPWSCSHTSCVDGFVNRARVMGAYNQALQQSPGEESRECPSRNQPLEMCPTLPPLLYGTDEPQIIPSTPGYSTAPVAGKKPPRSLPNYAYALIYGFSLLLFFGLVTLCWVAYVSRKIRERRRQRYMTEKTRTVMKRLEKQRQTYLRPASAASNTTTADKTSRKQEKSCHQSLKRPKVLAAGVNTKSKQTVGMFHNG